MNISFIVDNLRSKGFDVVNSQLKQIIDIQRRCDYLSQYLVSTSQKDKACKRRLSILVARKNRMLTYYDRKMKGIKRLFESILKDSKR